MDQREVPLGCGRDGWEGPPCSEGQTRREKSGCSPGATWRLERLQGGRLKIGAALETLGQFNSKP